MIEVVIDSVRASLVTPQKMILLRETAQDRYLPIFIGTCEAEAIVIELLNQRVPRPLTHDLLKSVIGALEGRVSHVLVSELRNDIFFAKIIIDLNGEKIEVDSRPSDAMALAVRTKSSVFVAESVMDEAGISSEKDILGEVDVQEPSLEELGPFRDFVDSLDLDDFTSD